ncbi:NAD(P)/FAD-dependent oxidoreductase [Chitinophagaceae bacterium LWZ2-11]
MKVVIVGGGFAGLKLARELNNKQDIEVLLLNKVNYHQFQPLFYQVATAGLDASNISFPLRKVFQKSKNVTVRLADVKEILSSENKVTTDVGDFSYDYLVLATGADTNFFGNKQLQEACYPMKSTMQALQIRNKLIQNFEDALVVADKPKELEATLSIIVVGGGATGVEVSGALSEMKKYVLPKDYPSLNATAMKIYLLEGSPKTLGAMSEKSSAESRSYLEKLGVIVRTGTVVKEFDGNKVTLGTGETIETHTVIWAAGIKGNVLPGISQDLLVRGNRIKVDRQNRIQGFENVYAIGDVSYMETPKYPHGHPQLANVAINQAKTLAENFTRMLNGNKHYQVEFEYHDKGSMATVGKHKAVVDLPKPKIHLGGLIAWLIWMFLHLMLILGVKNKLQIFINWMYKYFTSDQSLRLIFTDFYRPVKRRDENEL